MVASDVGGIPEVVDDGVTGLLVHYDESGPGEFEAGLAAAVNALVADPERAEAMGQRAGSARSASSPGRRLRQHRGDLPSCLTSADGTDPEGVPSSERSSW